MPKEERHTLSIPNNRSNRVSPYPLRSSRTNNKSETYDSFTDAEDGVWDDVRCVICMEPPHNAVLLRCSSFTKGCHTYICDTSARHSNCFKQYRKNNKNRTNPNIFNCPLCRGEVSDTMKVTDARRFMNAKPRPCTFESCDFSGTYNQLQKHSKTDHPGPIPRKVDPIRQQTWDQIQRDADYLDFVTAASIPQLIPRIPDAVSDIVHNHLSQVTSRRVLDLMLPRLRTFLTTLYGGDSS